MAATDYQYSIATDFPNHKVATDRLQQEIQSSAILIALERIDTLGDACDIWFKDSLSAGDETILDGIVAVHSGEPLPSSVSPVTLTSPSGHPITTPQDRLLVVNFPADFGANLWLTGRGDDVANSKRGDGTALSMTFADVSRPTPEVQSLDIEFMEQVQLHDGQLFVGDPSTWDVGDEWTFGVYIPETVATPAPGNDGNCNLVDAGGFNVIVPAAGDGTHNVDLATAVPVPDASGYWDYDYSTNVLTASESPGQAAFVLLDVPVQAYMQKSVPVPFHPMGVFDFDAYDAQRISPRWKLRLSVKKVSNGPGKLAGWIVVFRAQNT